MVQVPLPNFSDRVRASPSRVREPHWEALGAWWNEVRARREHFAGNGLVAFQGEQEIGSSGGVMRGAEDFVLVFL
jgi:hypothetical protein